MCRKLQGVNLLEICSKFIQRMHFVAVFCVQSGTVKRFLWQSWPVGLFLVRYCDAQPAILPPVTDWTSRPDVELYWVTGPLSCHVPRGLGLSRPDTVDCVVRKLKLNPPLDCVQVQSSFSSILHVVLWKLEFIQCPRTARVHAYIRL